MNGLPLEIIVHIFQYLSKEEQLKVSEVNKKFREALFSPTIWTESEKRMVVPASQMKSFRKFLKQTTRLKYLNLLVKGSTIGRPSTVCLTQVFRSLNNLECLALQLKDCNPRMTFFPPTLNHISLEECESDITDDILIKIADSCPQLDHIQIKSNSSPKFGSKGLTYLLKKVEGTLRTLILSIPYRPSYMHNPVFYFPDCPLNLTTLCLFMDFDNYHEQMLKLPNLENLKFLSLVSGDNMSHGHYTNEETISSILANCSLKSLMYLYLFGYFPFHNEELYAKFAKLSNFQVLYLDSCDVDIDVLVRFIKECSSLKVLAWRDVEGYSKRDLFELAKLKKEKPVEIYLNFTEYETENEDIAPMQFPNFPNENFDCLKTFNHLFDEFFDEEWPKYFNCHAPIIKKSKALLGI